MPIRSRNRRGQTALMFTLATMLLFGMLGLVVDIGWAYFRKEAAQTAADATAQAAALSAYSAASGGSVSCGTTGVACWTSETDCPSSITTPANNMQKGCLYAYANGFTPSSKVRVTLQSGVGGAPTAPGVTISYWVTAKVVETETQLFSAVLGNRIGTVAARATTGIRDASNGGCVITLNPNAAASLRMTGTTNLTSGCGVFVNSNNAGAITAVGGGTITTTGSARTQIVGNWTGSGTISPAPQTGVPTMTDPFTEMAPPPYSGCDSSGISLGSHQNRNINNVPSSGTMVICGDINLSAQSSLNLSPGMYVVTGNISLGAQTSMTGSGVTFYLPNGGVNMAGGASVNLAAPSSGSWQGILFYERRGNATASTLVGGTTQQMSGVIYMPSAHLSYTGGSSTNATATTLVSDTLELVGNSNIQAAATTQYTGVTGGVFIVE